jgi:hypothetical protein
MSTQIVLEYPDEKINWELYWRWSLLVLWCLFIKLPIAGVYVIIVSDGFRSLVQASAIRFSKTPIIGPFFGTYKVLEKIDGAYVLAIALMLAVFYFWDRLLNYWLDGEDFLAAQAWKNKEWYVKFITVGGGTVLGGDACLFLRAVTNIGWKGTKFTFSALVAVIVYIAVIVFVTFVSVELKKRISVLKNKEKP